MATRSNRSPRSSADSCESGQAGGTSVASAVSATPLLRSAKIKEAEHLSGAALSGNATRIVARGRLLTQLLEARRKRGIVIHGPAGSGKTTLLRGWREALVPLGFHVLWQGFTAEDNDLRHGLDHLVATLTELGPEVSQQASLLLERGIHEDAAEAVAISLVRGIAAHRAEVVLILDDMHVLNSAESHEVLQCLLEYAPANLHLVFVSRSAIPLSLGRLRDTGLVLELDMRDLRFTAGESLEFLRAQLGSIHPRDARRLHDLTDGWAAGLQLLAMRLKRHNKTEELEENAVKVLAQTYLLDAQSFSDYFDREVLSRLADAEVELLVRTSICTRVCASLCLALMGDELPASEVLALLTKLGSENLFSRHDPGHEGTLWHSLNPLFREALLSRFHARSPNHQRDVHRAAWLWFREHGQPDEAVRHALRAGETAAAVALVRETARRMRLQGQFRQLGGLMRLLPQEDIHARIDLRLWMVMLQLYSHEFEACARGIDTLGADILADDHHARYQLALMRAALGVQQDDPDAVAAWLPYLQEPPQGVDDLMLGARNNLLAWLHVHRGDYTLARQIHADHPKLFVDGAELLGTSAGTLNLRCVVALSYAIEGRFVQAERLCRDVLFEANQRGSMAPESACLASSLLGEMLYESNELDAARKLLEDRVDVLERVSIPDSVLRLHLVLSSIHWAEGHQQEAFAYLKRLEDYATQRGLQRLVIHSVAEQVRRHLAMGQHEEASQGLARLDEAAQAAHERTHIFSDEIRLVVDRAHLHRNLSHGEFDVARITLQSLIELCERRGWQRELVQLQLQAALLAHRHGATGNVQVDVMDILRRGSRLGIVRSLLDAGPEALQLITDVIEQQPHDPVLSFYLSRLQAARRPVPAASPAHHAFNQGPLALTEMLSEREIKVIGLLAKALPNKKIARTMGISPETVKWHLKNIYGKLGVSCRDEAVARVRDLNFDAEWMGEDTLS